MDYSPVDIPVLFYVHYCLSDLLFHLIFVFNISGCTVYGEESGEVYLLITMAEDVIEYHLNNE